jgi:hypothetical protein
MADLSEENWGSQLSERVSETENETTADEHAVICTERTQTGSTNHENATDGDGKTTTKSICQGGYERERAEGTNLVD